MTPKQPARLEAEKICKKFPRHGNLTLAKMLMEQFPRMFTSELQARQTVQRARGKDDRRYGHADAAQSRPLGSGMEGFPDSDYVSPAHLHVDCKRALILSDVHIPFQDNTAVNIALKYGTGIGCDCIILNGDILDFYSGSRFDRNPQARNMAGEIALCKRFLAMLRKRFPKAQIIYKEGNHELRWKKYLWSQAPALLGCSDFELPQVLKLDSMGIKFVQTPSMIQLGGDIKNGMPHNGLIVIHGHEANISGGVNPARTLYLRMGVSSLCGHLHKESVHKESIAYGKVIGEWSTGCLCGLYPEYLPINKWTQGFADVEVEGRYFEVHTHAIIDGRVL